MCGIKSIEERNREELTDFLSLEETLDGPARESRVLWYGHIFRRGGSDAVRRALDVEMVGRKERGGPEMT